jgi:hypothetical protein
MRSAESLLAVLAQGNAPTDAATEATWAFPPHPLFVLRSVDVPFALLR